MIEKGVDLVMRSNEFVGIAEGIKSLELSTKDKIEKCKGKISELSETKQSLYNQISYLKANLEAAYAYTDEDGGRNYSRIVAIESQINYAESKLSEVETQLDIVNGELFQSQVELKNIIEDKTRTLSEIQERAKKTSQNIAFAGGMYGAYAGVGSTLQGSMQTSLASLSKAASILDGSVEDFFGTRSKGQGLTDVGSSSSQGGLRELSTSALSAFSIGNLTCNAERGEQKKVSRHLNRNEVNNRWKSNVQDIDGQIENYKDALMERGVPDCEWLRETLAIYRASMLKEAGDDLEVASGKAEISINKNYMHNYLGDYSELYDELASRFRNYCLAKTNPNYAIPPKSPEWNNNCQRCVPTYESRRRGNEVSAYPSTFGSDHLFYYPFDVWKDAQVISCEGSGLSDIQHTLRSWGDGSRAQVVVHWNRHHGGGHTFVAEQVKGQTIFVDPQTGDSDVSRYFDRVILGQTKFCRIDNLDFSGYSNECYTEVRDE